MQNEAIPLSLNCRGKLLMLDKPLIMGILNVTPDSFSDGGRFFAPADALRQAEQMLAEGADLIDIGGYSSRPGATDISVAEEVGRIAPVIAEIARRFPEAILSVDTFRREVAQAAADNGAHLINDISAGSLDPGIWRVAAANQMPFIAMHMKGTPQTMAQLAEYEDVVQEVYDYFVKKLNEANQNGVYDVLIDAGFGFAKAVGHNYALFRALSQFAVLGRPLVVGISRKSMLYKLLHTTPDDVADATAALHLQALMAGAAVLRVHDVKAAARMRVLYQALRS